MDEDDKPSVNRTIQDDWIERSALLERLKLTEERFALRYIAEAIIPDALAKIEAGLNFRRAESVRLANLTRKLTELLDGKFSELAQQTRKRLQEIGFDESQFVVSSVKRRYPLDVDIVLPSRSFILSALNESTANGRPMGRPWSQWYRDLSKNTIRRTMDQVSLGVAQGDSVDRIVRRIRGTRANRYTDGVFATTRRQARVLARTGTQHVVSQARKATVEANKSIFKQEKWVSTLDSRTTQICAGLDGRKFQIGEGIYPPAHHQCRSIRVPQTKSFRELGINIDEAKVSTRIARQYTSLKDSLRGDVAPGTTFGPWLKRQPSSVQDNILGKSKADLWRRGKVPIEKFTDVQGRPLTLTDLQKIEKRKSA